MDGKGIKSLELLPEIEATMRALGRWRMREGMENYIYSNTSRNSEDRKGFNN